MSTLKERIEERMAQVISTTKHLTQAGESFDTMALNYCGTEMLATDIIALNPEYSDVVVFGEGVELTIPVYDTTETPETLPPWRK
jgi:hypothetical protein